MSKQKLTREQQARLKAFGDGISFSEGTQGYNTYFGGGTYDNNLPHPGTVVRRTPTSQGSSAAGRYQFMPNTWKEIHGGNVPMTEENQEAGFVTLLKRRGAYNDVLNGNFEQAYKKVTNEWASVKGNSYTFNGQPQGKHSPKDLATYTQERYKFHNQPPPPPPAGGILSSPIQSEQSGGLFTGKTGLTY